MFDRGLTLLRRPTFEILWYGFGIGAALAVFPAREILLDKRFLLFYSLVCLVVRMGSVLKTV